MKFDANTCNHSCAPSLQQETNKHKIIPLIFFLVLFFFRKASF